VRRIRFRIIQAHDSPSLPTEPPKGEAAGAAVVGGKGVRTERTTNGARGGLGRAAASRAQSSCAASRFCRLASASVEPSFMSPSTSKAKRLPASWRAAEATIEEGAGPHSPPPTERARWATCARRKPLAARAYGSNLGSAKASPSRRRRARRVCPARARPPAAATLLPAANSPCAPRSLGLSARASAGTPAGSSSTGSTSTRGSPAPLPCPLRHVTAHLQRSRTPLTPTRNHAANEQRARLAGQFRKCPVVVAARGFAHLRDPARGLLTSKPACSGRFRAGPSALLPSARCRTDRPDGLFLHTDIHAHVRVKKDPEKSRKVRQRSSPMLLVSSTGCRRAEPSDFEPRPSRRIRSPNVFDAMALCPFVAAQLR
jgi:hypothetical protein